MPEYVAGNIFMRVPDTALKKGQEVESHAHNFDHVTFIQKGSARIDMRDGIPSRTEDIRNGPFTKSVVKHAYELRNWVLIKKGVHHRIVALEDDTTYICVYSHRRADTEEVVEEYTGWMKAIT